MATQRERVGHPYKMAGGLKRRHADIQRADMVIMDRCVGEAATIPDPEAEPLEGRVRDLEQEVRDLRRLVEEQGLLIANLRRAVRVTGAAFSAAG